MSFFLFVERTYVGSLAPEMACVHEYVVLQCDIDTNNKALLSYNSQLSFVL